MDPRVGLPQNADQNRSQHPILLAVDQKLGEGAALRIAPELADPVGSVEVRAHEGRGAVRLSLTRPVSSSTHSTDSPFSSRHMRR